MQCNIYSLASPPHSLNNKYPLPFCPSANVLQQLKYSPTVCHFSQSATTASNRCMLRRFELKSPGWIQPAFWELSAEARKSI